MVRKDLGAAVWATPPSATINVFRQPQVLCAVHPSVLLFRSSVRCFLSTKNGQIAQPFSPVVRIGTPPPDTAGDCVPPPLVRRGGGDHSPAGEGVTLRS